MIEETINLMKENDVITRKFREKGVNVDNYSAFYDMDRRRDTGLNSYLNVEGIQQLFVVGLGLEKNIKNTVLDALALDYKVVVIQDACAGWQANEVKKAWKEMEKAGAIVVNTDRLVSIGSW